MSNGSISTLKWIVAKSSQLYVLQQSSFMKTVTLSQQLSFAAVYNSVWMDGHCTYDSVFNKTESLLTLYNEQE